MQNAKRRDFEAAGHLLFAFCILHFEFCILNYTLTHSRQVNKELWVVLSLFVVALLLNELLVSQRMVMSFYALPTVLSAYLYGRRHATLTAFASVLLVVLITLYSEWQPSTMSLASFAAGRWMDV